MLEKYCVEVIKYIEKNGSIPTEQILEKLNIPTKYASAINYEIKSNGWVTLTKSGAILKPSGSAFLAKLELSSPKQPNEQILEYLQQNGVGVYSSINSILQQHFHVKDTYDYSEVQQETRKIKDLLNLMVSNNLIELDQNDYHKLGSGNTNEGFRWLNSTTINASIKPDGIALIRENSQYSASHQGIQIEIQRQAAKGEIQKSVWLKSLNWILNHIIQILIALIVAYFVTV